VTVKALPEACKPFGWSDARPPGQPLASSGRCPVLVAGAGNWLLSSDRVGPRVLSLARDRYGPDVELCDIGSSALSLLDHLCGQDLLVVIDACIGRGEPGEVFVVEPDLDSVPSRGTSVHQIGPMETLIVAGVLEPSSMPARIVLLLVETGDFEETEEGKACQRVVESLDREIERWRRRRSTEALDGALEGGEP